MYSGSVEAFIRWKRVIARDVAEGSQVATIMFFREPMIPWNAGRTPAPDCGTVRPPSTRSPNSSDVTGPAEQVASGWW